MIIATGIDIVEINEIIKPIDKDEGFVEGIFTNLEIQYCESKKKKYQSYAARFAVKEAVMKAFGFGWEEGISWRDIETLNNQYGQPYIVLTGEALKKQESMKINNIFVSISHSASYAVASVIFES